MFAEEECQKHETTSRGTCIASCNKDEENTMAVPVWRRKSAISRSSNAGHGDSPEDKRYRRFLSLTSDPLPYGMAANRASIEALVTYSLQQELIPSRPQLDQVFVDIDP